MKLKKKKKRWKIENWTECFFFFLTVIIMFVVVVDEKDDIALQ
jgi:hypothetical protein